MKWVVAVSLFVIISNANTQEDALAFEGVPTNSKIKETLVMIRNNTKKPSLASTDGCQNGNQLNEPEERHAMQLQPTEEAQKNKGFQADYEKTSSLQCGKPNACSPEYVRLLHAEPLPQEEKEICQIPEINCDRNSKYRTYDGSCNNLHFPARGKTLTCHRRLLHSDYDNGVNTQRTRSRCKYSEPGEELPNVREISTIIHEQINRPSEEQTSAAMAFGQFIDHDMALTPIFQNVNGPPLKCCAIGSCAHPECFPIPIGEDDYFYGPLGITCLNFVRSLACPSCMLGPREQMNQLTIFLDCSMVYGPSKETADSLRTMTDGKMASQAVNGEELLPSATINGPFRAGDVRVNQNPQLLAYQTTFMRQHNIIATNLKEQNPDWDDEKLFQESRRILIAMLQIIVYKEYLPTILGPAYTRVFRLDISNKCTYYEPGIDPTAYNEFLAAYFRFGHSTIDNDVFRMDSFGNITAIPLRELFFKIDDFYNNEMKSFVRGMCFQPSQCFDRFMSEDVTNYVYSAGSNSPGLDLASLNIQRARDQGIPGYVKFVELILMKKIKNWKALKNTHIMDNDLLKLLENNYKCVEDIDLFTGFLCEKPHDGSSVGNTASDVIAKQFHNLLFGDRFFVTHCGQKGSFTKGQRKELMKVTLASILCATSFQDEPYFKLQRNVFQSVSPKNPKKACWKLDGVDYSKWKEE